MARRRAERAPAGDGNGDGAREGVAGGAPDGARARRRARPARGHRPRRADRQGGRQAAAENGGAKAEARREGRGATRGDGRGARRGARSAQPAAPEPQRGEAGPKGQAEIQELTRLQQTVSRRMAESKATAPDFSISLTVDMTAGGGAAQPAQGGGRPGAVLQRHGREGGRHRAARAPARERRLPRRQVRALRERQHRRRGGGAGRARGAHDLRRRPEVARPDLAATPAR